jgi:hypothetical protein
MARGGNMLFSMKSSDGVWRMIFSDILAWRVWWRNDNVPCHSIPVANGNIDILRLGCILTVLSWRIVQCIIEEKA